MELQDMQVNTRECLCIRRARENSRERSGRETSSGSWKPDEPPCLMFGSRHQKDIQKPVLEASTKKDQDDGEYFV